MYIDDKGIVLRTVKYDDKSFVAHLFTASHGHVSFIVNGSRNKRTGSIARLFQPLSFLSFQWEAKATATLHRMKEVRILFVQQDIPYNHVKRSIAMVLAEFMTYTLGNEGENYNLYIYTEHAIRWFDTAPTGYANFHLVFLLKLSLFLGIAPNMESFSQGDMLDLTNGRFTSSGTPSHTVMSANDTLYLFRLAESNYESMTEIKMSRHDRARLTHHIATYFTLHIPRFQGITSLEILSGLFED